MEFSFFLSSSSCFSYANQWFCWLAKPWFVPFYPAWLKAGWMLIIRSTHLHHDYHFYMKHEHNRNCCSVSSGVNIFFACLVLLSWLSSSSFSCAQSSMTWWSNVAYSHRLYLLFFRLFAIFRYNTHHRTTTPTHRPSVLGYEKNNNIRIEEWRKSLTK